MAMTEKQILKHMGNAWETHYSAHETEAEWYGLDDAYIWVCDIPSLETTVKLELDEQNKVVKIYETPLKKQMNYSRVRDAQWALIDEYTW